MVLMLDDVHHVAGTRSADVLSMIVDYLPGGVTVAVAGRTDGGLPVARLRASGRLVEIGVDDLAFDERESGMLSALDGRELRADEARELHVRTEGWPAAVYLATRRAQRTAGARTPAPIGVSGREPESASWRDPAVLLISQLKEIYIDAELDVVDTTQWYPRVMRKDFTVGYAGD